ncbi:MAG: peptide MFS transporter [Culturomica sp.]|jgi:POT family proton-dependent oligopeptide transporter|nr:peptide MFS transporter [Culturomica sp.]
MFKNHPKGLLSAALSNMGERFGYYIMNAVLVLFLSSKFGLAPATGSLIYSFFYAGIYVLSLVGGIIADKRSNYKGTIMTGLVVMAVGYALLSIPIMSTSSNFVYLLTFTCFALFLIAFGNGLFKGNLQAIVGQMYDDPKYSKRRDAGFQIFYVFINIGGLIAPFVAPILRSWWLSKNGFEYNSALPELCHAYLDNGAAAMDPTKLANLEQLATQVSHSGVVENLGTFSETYLNVFNTGVHYSFIASVAAMLISLVIFAVNKKGFPNPTGKKAADCGVSYTAEEKSKMAKDLKQRIMALFAVLGVAIFFWFSFHQNGVSLSYFARDFVITEKIAPEIWQCINPLLVVLLTPLVMFIFGSLSKKGKEPSTPMKIAIGMAIAGAGYLFLSIISYIQGLPSYNEYMTLTESAQLGLKLTPWVLIGIYFFLTVAELFISPLGLSFVSKVAPKNMQGLCQGLWLTATALGNILLFLGGMMYESWDLWKCWLVFTIVCIISMVVMLSMVRWLERVTSNQ